MDTNLKTRLVNYVVIAYSLVLVTILCYYAIVLCSHLLQGENFDSAFVCIDF